jgi:hypothetical protein
MEKQARENVKFELAKQIRTILDEARKAYGGEDWDDECVEESVLELVSEEG